MKRFIDHEELARDRRFIRQKSVAADLLAKLPDDVDSVVELFEKIEPIIEAGVRGTAAEPLYDRFGPAFTLMTLNEPIRPGDPDTNDRLKMRMHGVYVGELQALEGSGRSLWDFPDTPWEFKMNMARQCWDEARHVQIFEKLLDHVGGEVGMFAESTFLFEAACADDPALRVAGVNRALEGLACDVFRDSIEFAKQTNDEVMEQSIDYVLADELTHVRFGSEWVAEFCKDDSERLKAAREFRRETDRRFNFGGARSAEKGAAIPIAWEDRKFAGFTDEELEDLATLTGEGPSRKTMQEATNILVSRFQAKQGDSTEGAAQ